MATLAAKPLTAEEFFRLPDPIDGSKQELVNGKVITVPPPGCEHGEVQINIGFLLKSYVKRTKAGRVVSESGVVTHRNKDSVRGPGLSYYSKKRMALGRRVVAYHDQPPDLCVEILSPDYSKNKLRKKIKEYFAAGVRMVWVVDPEDRSVTVLTSPKEGRTLYEDSKLDGGDVLPGFSCPISEFFE
jgi:Uma2 family endonuclease